MSVVDATRQLQRDDRSILYKNGGDPERKVDVTSQASVCPDEFYKYKNSRTKLPSTLKARAQKLNQAYGSLVKVAVDQGDGDTFQLGYARVLQATKECKDMNATTNGAPEHNNVLPLPQASRVGPKSLHVRVDGTNASRLSSAGKQKTARKKAANTQLHCSNCEVLAKYACKLH